MTAVFLSVLKTAQVVSVFRKDEKLNYSNYRAIFLLSAIQKILEKLALIKITENIRKALDDGNIGC